jgi:3-dehydroquinate dehydratase/shikimate dehydrogenase
VTASNTAELRRKRDALVHADLVELRLDSVADPDAAGALAGRRRPVIVTCRPTWEGGQFDGSEEERRRILGEALALGADYVDIEWKADFRDLPAETGGQRIVLSNHDFAGVPDDLPSRLRAMRATGAEIVKLAARANRLSDCLPLLDLGAGASRDGGVVVVAMGPRGLCSRILAGRFGSAWTYAGPMSDVGQVSLEELLDQYRFRTIGESTEVYGVVGSPVGHSVSPAMHNAAFEAATLDAVYLPLDAADADDFVTFARGIGLSGASVTIPFKVALFERVDEVDAVARRVGAINTIRVAGDRWVGANTDASGFLRPLQEQGVALRGARAAILGAGGAARAVAIALGSVGADVTVHARNPARARDVALIVSGAVGPWPPAAGAWDLLVNCTPIGMHPHRDETPVRMELLTGRVVYDLVYNPPFTRFLREAAAAGCQTIGGLDMLVGQADEQFQWWIGSRPQPGVMRAAALKRLMEYSTDANHVV